MATVLVLSVSGDELLGPTYFEAPPRTSELRHQLQVSLQPGPSQEIVLHRDGTILSDSKKLEGGTAENPLVLSMVMTPKTFQAVFWGAAPLGKEVSNQLGQGIQEVASTKLAFAALTTSGSVITWGSSDDGGNSEGVAGLDEGVLQVVGNGRAFVALKTGGKLVVWGNAEAGGKPPPEVCDQLRSGVVSVARTQEAFAALKENGEVVTWGNPAYGGDSSSAAGSLENIVSVVGTWGERDAAFAALTASGGVVTWGHADTGDMGSSAEKLHSGVKSICASGCSFAALKETGEVVCWGDPERGGEPVVFFSENDEGSTYSVQGELAAGVVSIVASDDVFVALKEGGKVVAWGMGADGAHLKEEVAKELESDVVSVSPNKAAFAALKPGGRVVTWGVGVYGGDSSSVAEQLQSGVVKIPFFSLPIITFAAVKEEGSLVVWGGFDDSLTEYAPHDELQSGVVDVVGCCGSYVALKYASVTPD
ncbi:unnamed protein product [Effrenium voratum]|nr:unnamed protein product [Effrenium voratum]